MAWIDKNLETYLQRQFPDRIVKGYYDKGKWQLNRYIQISTVLKNDMDIHYEYYQGHVELHLEGKNHNAENQKFVNQLHQQSAGIPSLSWLPWQGKKQFRCQIDMPVNSWGEVTAAFDAMVEIFDPIIDAVLKQKSMQEKNTSSKSDEQNKNIDAAIVSVGEVLNISNLRIPEYQRPYCWEEKNVIQLLNDVDTYRRSGKSIYRIGSVMLHKNKTAYDIVDGQQRLTTICMILDELKQSLPAEIENLGLRYDKELDRVKKNSSTIQQWIEKNLPNLGEKESLYNYLIGNKESKKGCQFVRIIVEEISEAFQIFDTQNGRGKELEAYNLLKAYHIRAMEQDSESTKVKCDKRWEDATSYKSNNSQGYNDKKEDILKYIFDETLYRSRKWSRREPAGRFSKKEIDEFKGFTIDKNHNVQFPFQNPQLLQYITSKFYESVLSGTIGTISRFKNGDPDNMDPFVNINQTLVNGKSFFDYVETYVEIYKRIFIELDSYQLRNFKDFYKKCCKDTHGRSGDMYLQNVYKSLIIMLFDRFGEIGVEEHYKSLFFIVYQYRLSQQQVKYDGIAKNTDITQIFADISQATNMIDLNKIQKTANEISIEVNFKNSDINAVVDEFKKKDLINETKKHG